MRRNYIALLVVGLLMVAAIPFVWRLNHRVTLVRLDGATVSYFMRADVFLALVQGGFTFTLAAVIALMGLRGRSGRFAQAKAVLPAIPCLVFATAAFAKLVVAVPYVRTVYDTAPGFQTVPMTLRNYYTFIWVAQAIGIIVFACFFWQRVALVYRHRGTPQPTCDECGYSLRGLESPTCPECGTLSLKLVKPVRADACSPGTDS